MRGSGRDRWNRRGGGGESLPAVPSRKSPRGGKEKLKRHTNATGDESKLDFCFSFCYLCAAKFDFAGEFLKAEFRERGFSLSRGV